MKHHIHIHYCTQCRWLLRASWMSQELLTTFDQDIAAMTLRPASGGLFEIWIDDQLIWSRKAEGRFPEIAEIKQKIRDLIDPTRSLGHSDRKQTMVGAD